jgi:hypothetical protein
LLKITEIKIDDSQTGYYWLQIFVKNQREGFALREQILRDQEIRERLEKSIQQCQQIAENSTVEMEVIIQNMLKEKLESILDSPNA